MNTMISYKLRDFVASATDIAKLYFGIQNSK